MKTKLTIDLPDLARLVAGLAPRDLHPRLVRAEESATEAEQALARARRELEGLERVVAAMPDRVHAGEAQASALAEALRQRDARALLIAPAELVLAKARERVALEERAAQQAVATEVTRRGAVLERTAAELAPVLAELRELSQSLARVLHPDAVGGFRDVDWPCALGCDVAHHVATVAAARQAATTDRPNRGPTTNVT